MNILPQQPKEIQINEYQLLIDDCKSIIVEGEFTSRWSLIETYHAVGKRISEEKEVSIKKLARDINKSERTLQRSVQFYKKYPDLALLPDGKNVSWHHIVNKYLPDTLKDKKEIHRCEICGGDLEASCHTTSNGKL
jgi:hypothetical protein